MAEIKQKVPLLKENLEEGKEKAADLSSTTTTIINILKGTVGAGIFFLPEKLYKAGLLWGGPIMVVMAFLATYSFYVIGKACEIMGVDTYADAMKYVGGKKWGKTLTHITGIGMIVFCLPIMVMYGIIIGSYSQKLFGLAGYEEDTYPVTDWQMFLFFALPLLILSYPKRLSMLKYSSYVGVGAVALGMILIAIKGLSARERIPMQPIKNDSGNTAWIGLIQVATIMCASMLGHFSGPKFYQNMENKAVWGKVSTTVMVSTAIAYIGIAILGCMMYDKCPDDLIFKDFQTQDQGAWKTLGMIAQALIVLTLVGGYPMFSHAVRDSILHYVELYAGPADRSKKGFQNTRFRRGVVAIAYMVPVVLATVFLAIVNQSAAGDSLDMAVIILGNLLAFTFPGMMMYAAFEKKTTFQNVMMWILIVIGPLLSIVGLIDFILKKIK